MNLPSAAPSGPTSQAVPSQAGRSEEQASAQAIGALLACVYRLFKVARMYDATHQILATETEVATSAVVEFCLAMGADSADLVFVGETVFVNGQMPRFSREAYSRAMELAGLLDRCGISNLTFAKTLTPANVLAFVSVVANVLRDTARAVDLTSHPFVGIRARRLRARIGGEGAELDQSPAARVVRTYACTIVILRGFYESLTRDRPKMPAALRRVAQRIVTHAEQEPALLVGLAAGTAREHDEAATATGTALVAVLMARQLTSDRSALTNLTLAALLQDAGRQEVLRGAAADSPLAASMRTLTDDEQDRLARSAAVGVASLDRIEGASVARAVVAFESQWLRRAQRLGPIYRGKRPASALARILFVARSFCELMAPGPYATPMAAEDAIQFLSSRAADEGERTYVKLLTGALGIFPPGTTVELSTREIGVVTSVPALPVDFSRPPVRIMYDSAGNKLDPPLDVDLAVAPEPGQPDRMIHRTFDADQQQTQAMRAYVLAVTSGQRGRARSSGDTGSSSPGSDSRSGKRPVANREPVTGSRGAPPPAFDERPPTSPGLDSRPRLEARASAAFEERPPTGAGLQSRPRSTLLGGATSGPAVGEGRAKLAGPASGAFDERPSTGRGPASGAFDNPPSTGSGRLSAPGGPESAGPTSTGRRAAWKARQAERPRVFDPRAERESDVPPRPASTEPLSRSELAPHAVAPSVRTGPASPSIYSQPTQPRMPQITPEQERAAASSTRPTARPAPASAAAGTRKVNWSDYDEIVDEATPPPAELTPAPAGRPTVPRLAAARAGSVAGTRKVAWDDYDDLVEQTGKRAGGTVEGAPAPDAGSTRRATWDETEALGADDNPPEDDGI